MTDDWQWLSAAEMAGLLMISRQAFNAHVRRHGWREPRRRWSSANPQGAWRPDGKGFAYHYRLLPPRLAAAHQAKHLPAPEDPTADRSARRAAVARDEAWSAFERLSSGSKTKARQRLAILQQVRELERCGWGTEAAVHEVARLRKVGRSSIWNWFALVAGIAAPDWLAYLVDRRCGRQGGGVFERSAPLREHVIGTMTLHPHLDAQAIWRDLAARFGGTVPVADPASGTEGEEKLPSARSVLRFMTAWKAKNPALWARATDPDGYRNKFAYAAGAMYAHIARRNQLWEIDASPSDAMCTDGRHSIYVMVDVHSRWPRVRVTKTPRTAAALLLVRDCILGWPGQPDTAWGVPEELRTDRGSDFTSEHFRETLQRLGIPQDICDPYSPQQKAAVERAIGTIQHQFMELLPGYVGHGVADRKRIEARKTFAQRLGETDADTFRVELAAAELQQRLNDWIEHVYVHQPHEGLGGKTPFQARTAHRGRVVHVEGEGALEMLLCPPVDGGTRTVTKKGIRVDSIDYHHPALMPGDVVHVRLDPDDLGRVHVYRDDPWEFIGLAVNPERAGVSRQEVAAEVKARQKAALKAGMAEIKQAQRAIKGRDISLEITEAGRRANGGLAAFPDVAQAHAAPGLTAAGAAARAIRGEGPRPVPMTPGEADRRHRLIEAFKTPAEPVRDEREQRWRRAMAIEAAMTAGEEVAETDLAWLRRYSDTSEYRVRVRIRQDFEQARA